MSLDQCSIVTLDGFGEARTSLLPFKNLMYAGCRHYVNDLLATIPFLSEKFFINFSVDFLKYVVFDRGYS